MNPSAEQAREALARSETGEAVSIAEIMASVRTLSSEGFDGQRMARALRSAVVRGLREGEADEPQTLRTYVILATRFEAWVDVWNAATLLDRRGSLDAEMRALRTVAFVNVFPDEGAREPDRVLWIMEKDPEPRWAKFVLVRRIDAIGRHMDHGGSVGTATAGLASALSCRRAWLDDRHAREVEDEWSAAAGSLARRIPDVDEVPDYEALAKLMTRATDILARRLEEAYDRDEASSDPPHASDPAPSGTVPTEQPGDAIAAPADTPDDVLRATAKAIERDRRFIWVVGRYHAPHHLQGVAKGLGFDKPASVLRFMSYDDVASKSLPAAIDPARDVGVILGAVPHKAKDVGDNSSLLSALRDEYGLDVVPVRQNSTSGSLTSISKTAFRLALRKLLAAAAPALAQDAAQGAHP